MKGQFGSGIPWSFFSPLFWGWRIRRNAGVKSSHGSLFGLTCLKYLKVSDIPQGPRVLQIHNLSQALAKKNRNIPNVQMKALNFILIRIFVQQYIRKKNLQIFRTSTSKQKNHLKKKMLKHLKKQKRPSKPMFYWYFSWVLKIATGLSSGSRILVNRHLERQLATENGESHDANRLRWCSPR